MNNFSKTFTAEYENTLGKIERETFVSENLEVATMEATTKAEENGWELLAVYYTNQYC